MTIDTVFNQYASEYDEARKRLIPCFDDFYQTVVDIVPYGEKESFSVLDLGAGTGLVTLMLADRYTNAQFTLYDIAEKMLDHARKRLVTYGNRFDYRVVNYSESGFLNSKFDLIVSGLSIHHLDNESKSSLFTEIHEHLFPGGMFINADQVQGETPEIDDFYRKKWVERIKQLGCSDGELKAAFERMKEDKMSPLSHQFQLLKERGFQQINCWFKHLSFVVYSGQK